MCWFTLRIKETAEQLLCRIQWRLRCILVHFFLLHRQHFDLHFWLETTTSINQCRFFGFYWFVWVPTFSYLCFFIFCFDCYKWCKLWLCWFLISIAIVNLIILKTFLFWKQLLLFNILWLSNFWLLFYCFGNDLGRLCMNPFWLHGNSTSVHKFTVFKVFQIAFNLTFSLFAWPGLLWLWSIAFDYTIDNLTKLGYFLNASL